MSITKAPISNVKGLHYESKLFRVVICKLENDSITKGFRLPSSYPAIEIISIDSTRPNDSRTGMVIEAIAVTKYGEALPDRQPIKNEVLNFDQTGIKFGEKVWTDDLEMCEALSATIADQCLAENEAILEEVQSNISFLKSLKAHGA